MLHMFKWTEGRQGTGYQKMCLWSAINFDIYLLRFPVGTVIPQHRDVVPGKEHHRLNIWLRRAIGGQFWTLISPKGDRRFYGWKRCVKFRPDIQWHGLCEVMGTKTAYMLSIGWTKNE